jgi:hypothetical protein
MNTIAANSFTFSAEELKALDVESSKVIDLETFVPRGDIDPVYFDTPYYLYPDGSIAVEALRVIGAAMTEACVVGIGRLALSRRERIVMLEPRGSGMALFTLRAAEEVRAAQFGDNQRDLDPEMVAIARAIIGQRLGKFDPSAYRDRYQEALRGLIAVIAATGSRRRKTEGEARDRPGRRRHQTAKKGVNCSKRRCARQIALALLSAAGLKANARARRFAVASAPRGGSRPVALSTELIGSGRAPRSKRWRAPCACCRSR